MPDPLYLDHAASAPLDPAVADAMRVAVDAGWGNAASVHGAGVKAATALERARRAIAARLGADPRGLTFTSGGTEANNLAILGIAAVAPAPGHLVVGAIDHSSVAAPAAWLEARGWAVTRLPVDGQGRLDPDDLQRALRRDTALVSVGHGNQEVGTVQPVAALGAVCRAAGVPLHLDACQSFTKVPLDAREVAFDLVTVNAHKLHGPTGFGALWVREGIRLAPLLHGGGQEAGLRPGTANVLGAVGFAAAVARATPEAAAQVAATRQALLAALVARFPGVRMNGPADGALPHIASVTFPGADGRVLFDALNREGIMVSRGSACSAGSDAPSPVLTAMGIPPEEARGTLRLSPGRTTRPEDLQRLVDALARILEPTA